MSLDFASRGLKLNNGIWYTDKHTEISYPKEGNEMCYQIEENSFWFRHRNNCIVALLKNYPPKGTFFDMGGGNGYVAREIENNGYNTVLLEPGEAGCIHARERGLKNVICSTLEDASFEKESIPAIGVFDVVEHFENDLNFLQYIHSYLIKDGMLYITVPAYNFLWSNEDTEGGHHNRYTLKGLSAKLNKIGFKVCYSSYIFSILPVPIFLLRSLPSKLGLNKNSSDFGKHQNEHKSDSTQLNKIWNWELNRIKSGKSIPFGGSCLVVAQKI